MRTFETRPPMIVRAKQVAFGEEGAIVVGGSDHGRVYVFETSSGNVLQALQHSKASMVQTVTVGLGNTSFESMLNGVCRPETSMGPRSSRARLQMIAKAFRSVSGGVRQQNLAIANRWPCSKRLARCCMWLDA